MVDVDGRHRRPSGVSRSSVGLLAPAPPATLAVLEDRGVVRRVAHLGVDLAGLVEASRSRPARDPASAGSARPRRVSSPSAACGRAARSRRARPAGAAPGRAGVAVMTRTPKNAEQHEQRHHDVRRAEQVEQQARDDVADGAAGLAQVAGVAETGLRVAVGDVDDAEHAEGEGDPADDLAAGRAVVLGVAHVAPADEHEQRAAPASRPCRPSPATTVRTALHHRAGELPPDRGGGDDGQPEDEQPDAVATVLGVEVAGAVADAAGDRAEAVGDRRARRPRRRGRARRRPGATGPGPLRTARGAGRRLRVGARLLEDRVGFLVVVPCVRVPDSSGGPSRRTGPTGLGRAPAPRTRRGRRTGRHDTNVGNRHSSHTDHTGVSAPERTAILPRSGLPGSFPVSCWTRRRGDPKVPPGPCGPDLLHTPRREHL